MLRYVQDESKQLTHTQDESRQLTYVQKESNMLTYVQEECKLVAPSEAKIVLESNNFEELGSKNARDAAIKGAGMLGLNPAGISNESGPYLRMPNGKPIETDEDIERYRQECLLSGGKATQKYYNEFTLRRSSLSI